MANSLVSQKQSAFASPCEEMRSTASVAAGHRLSVVCPKPQRPVPFAQGTIDLVRPLRWPLSGHQVELCDSRASAELLDIILTKGGGCDFDQIPSPVASSPPFFCGSPPSRATNPLVQDARFGKEKPNPISPNPMLLGLPSSPSPASPRKGCARGKFGLKPAAVRIEGFNCLDRDRQNRSIPAVA